MRQIFSWSKTDKQLPGVAKIQSVLADFEHKVQTLAEGIEELASRKNANAATIGTLTDENREITKEINNAEAVRTQLNGLLNKK